MHFAFLGWSITNMISLAIYIVSAFAFYKLAKLRCLNNAWLAFIPFFSLYIIGYIGDTLKYNTAPFNHYLSDIPLAYALPLLSIFSPVAANSPSVGWFGQLTAQPCFISVRCWFICSFSSSMRRRTNFYSPSFR